MPLNLLSDIAKGNVAGQLKGPAPNTSIDKVVDFVETHLETFGQEYSRLSLTNERDLTQNLCFLLDKQARLRGDRFPFLFMQEYLEVPGRGDSPTVDIAVIGLKSNNPFFKIETKRLDFISKKREKEYLTGRWENGRYKDCGGVERFKKGIHGRGLHYCALIGYVQTFDFDHWHCAVNSWIDEFMTGDSPSMCQWSEDDKLIEIHKTTVTARFHSKNSRQEGFINLFHLWVNLVVEDMDEERDRRQ